MSSFYNDNEIFNVRCLYIAFSLLWLLIIITLKLFDSSSFIILLIPFFLFGIAFINANYLSSDCCDSTMQITFISIGLLLSIPMITLIKTSKKDSSKLITILITAMILTLFSYFHLWLPLNYQYISKHSKSCFETMAVTLFIYALANYFYYHMD